MVDILDELNAFPSQRKVAELMLNNGIKVKDGRAYCGEIELADLAIARAVDVDRRVVKSTLDRISSTPSLYAVFSKLRSMPMLMDVAPLIGCSVIEIVPTDSKIPGILADVMGVVFSFGSSIKQAVISDSGFSESKATLVLIIEGQLPAECITKLRTCRGVEQVILK